MERWRRRWPAFLILALALVWGVAAVVVPSSPAADVRLHDGTVLVTNARQGLIGRLNHEIDRFVSAVPVRSQELDVLQDGSTAVARDRATNQLLPIDAAQSTLGAPIPIPANAIVELGRDTLVIVNPASGRGWARPAGQMAGVDMLGTKADFDLGPGGTATATRSGQAIGLSVARGELIRPGHATAPTRVPIALRVGDGVQLSAVGERAVVLNQATRQIWVEGRNPVTLTEGDGALLQVPSPDAPITVAQGGLFERRRSIDALIATRSGLIGVAGDDAVALAPGNGGLPTRPVVAGGCAYATFTKGADAVVTTACRDLEPGTRPLPEYAGGGTLAIRANRDIVVLNDISGGVIWLLSKDLRVIRDWGPVSPPASGQPPGPGSPASPEVSAARREQNRPPLAKDDTMSARAGRSISLPILDNDSDPDGDIITARDLPELAVGALSPVDGGTGVQLTLPGNAPPEIRFTYTIDDGRGGRAAAQAVVSVLPADQEASNRPPVLRPDRDHVVDVPLGGSATLRALLGWVDPDGDDLILVSAKAAGDDEVTLAPDGTLTLTDAGTKPGRKEIEVVVSDGRTPATGRLKLNARPPTQVAPVANGDHVTVESGRSVTVRPLLNDTGGELTLSAVDQVPGAQIAPDYARGSFVFTAAAPGTYYVGYTLSNGSLATGLVRIDALEPQPRNSPPVVTRDTALLPAGGTVEVDPLANDEDPDGDVLVLQNVGAHPDLQVRMIQRRGLVITPIATPERPITVPYTVSDGRHSVTGNIVVIPAPAATQTRPLAVPDEVTVREGDTVSVAVLANDSSPVGSRLILDRDLAEVPEAAVAWTDGEQVRFTAPRVAGEYHAVYQVRDPRGQTASARIRFLVVGSDVDNTAPIPRRIESRILAGSTGRLMVPLRGIDPQGDGVRLVGIATPPRLGRVVGVTEGWLVYEAYAASAGTDVFRYEVTDALGARATEEVRVGVVPRSAGNIAPAAGEDRVVAKPGRRVKVPVLANDSDADGDPVGFADQALDFPPEADARLADDMIEVTVPAAPRTLQGHYTVVDSQGAQATGAVVVTADPAAELAPPVARDDTVSVAAVARRDEVVVPVLANDYDPDGELSRATVSIPPSDGPERVKPIVDGDRVVVQVAPTMQQVRYQLTDADGRRAFGVITVPGRADAGPVRLPGTEHPVVRAGDPLQIDLADHIVGSGGRMVGLTAENSLSATNGVAVAVTSRTVRFQSPAGFAGPASVAVEVTDGRDALDPGGRRATVTIPITVLPRPADPQGPSAARGNRAPRSTPATLTVGVGEKAKSLALATTVTDPDGDELTFVRPVGQPPPGVRVEATETTITASAEPGVPPGTRVEFVGEARDGQGGRAPVEIAVVVASSTRPRPHPLDDLVPEAVAGRTATVPVLANDANPFPGRPLTLTRAVLESGRGEVSVQGDRVLVTPAPDFTGTLVARYGVTDAANDPARRAEGRVRLTVVGRPGRPGVPRVVEAGDGQVALTWSAAKDNGTAIRGYTLSASGPDGRLVVANCPTTTCTLTGLTNGVAYTMSVVATSAAGFSDPSGRSAPVRPDIRPGPPGIPQVRPGDKQVLLAWSPAATRGSAVERYLVEVSGPQGTQVRDVPGTATSFTWTGLTNGAGYRFRVRALSLVANPSEYSGFSDSAVPAGTPSAPRGVRASDSGGALGRQVTVRWQAPATINGDDVCHYTVYANGQKLGDVPGHEFSRHYTMENGTSYTFTVSATNKAGESPVSVSSAPVTPLGAPGRAEAPRLSVTANDPMVRASPFAIPASNGRGITSWQVRINRGSVREISADAAASGWSLSGEYGQPLSIEVVACAGDKCGDRWSDPSEPVVPFGVPGAPQVAAERTGGQVALIADTRAAAANGRPIGRREIRIDDGEWRVVEATFREVRPVGPPGTRHVIESRVHNEAGAGAIARAEMIS